ncbi:glycosyltransferase [Clostridium sp. 1001271B_150615_H5]|uniref:glycosyltransferase n=2 Tax=unclassified Clostridium TaxID=2614128 RepID=UPI0011062738|nr:glycosyltransferase [Clostridium sp. 1001271B_150615_H5]
MKKICMITTVSLTLKVFVMETAKYLHKQCGYDVTLICDNDEEFKISLPNYIHYIPVHMARGVDITGIKSIIEFIKIFRNVKFDMVQYSTPNAACYASIAAKITKVPVRLYCQWGIRYVGMDGISRKIFKAIEKMVCRNSTDIRAVSPMNKAFAVSEGLYPEERAIVVGKGGTIGVDMQRYDISKKADYRSAIRNQYGISDEAFVYGFAGRVSVDKGFTELLTAFRIIRESEPNAKLFIVGSMEDNCDVPVEILEWARKSEQVVMTGMVDGSKMNEYYSAMDVLVHPTYREGFGMVLQEAGALGIAMITTKIPGASEVMENGISCVLVEPKNISELASAMKRLISDVGRTKEIGQAAFERTKQYYNRPIMLENQKADYEKLLSKRGTQTL